MVNRHWSHEKPAQTPAKKGRNRYLFRRKYLHETDPRRISRLRVIMKNRFNGPSPSGDKDASAAEKEQNQFGLEAPAAMRRLAAAVNGRDSGQAQVVAAALASIYNGSEAMPVRLDEIRGLDWPLQRDLVTVMLGTGHAGCSDVDIRKAFFEVGGESAVNWFHWYTTGGPHRAALDRLVKFIASNSSSTTASTLRNTLRAFYNRETVQSVEELRYVSDQGPDLALVINAFIGADSGKLDESDIESAFQKHGIADALLEERWPQREPTKKSET